MKRMKKPTAKQLLAGGAAAIALLTTACPQPVQNVTYENTWPIDAPEFDLNTEGTLKIKIICRKGTNVDKIKTAISGFRDATQGSVSSTKNDMINKAGDYKIIVEYTDAGIDKYNGIEATNGQTIRVHADWLSSNANISVAALRVAFDEMVVKDLPVVAHGGSYQNSGVPLHLTTPYLA